VHLSKDWQYHFTRMDSYSFFRTFTVTTARLHIVWIVETKYLSPSKQRI